MNGFQLDGRVALVTGGSRGLGHSMARALAAAGADVVICSRSADKVEAAARELAAASGRRVTGMGADVTRAEDRDRLLEAALAAHGRVDILMNNAGIGMR